MNKFMISLCNEPRKGTSISKTLWQTAFMFVALCGSIARGSAPATSPTLNDQFLWEGRFDQCSFNAVSSVLAYYREPHGLIKDRTNLEKQLFNMPLDQLGYGAYFGWGPWTSYMVTSGRMIWNGKPVNDLAAERFSLRPNAMPTFEHKRIVVRYEKGERERLCDKLFQELTRGPVILWTPYAGVIDAERKVEPWHHVQRVDELTDSVESGNFTHSVTLFLKPDHAILVTDCSMIHGVIMTDAPTIVSTSAAMVALVNLPDRNGKSMFDNGFKGIKNDEYNVVFYPAAPTTQPTGAASSQTISYPPPPKNSAATLDAATARAGSRAAAWNSMLNQLTGSQLGSATYVYVHLPQRDLETMEPGLVQSAVAHSSQARNDFPWGKKYPDEIFDQAVLPLSNLSETREPWWDGLGNICKPIVQYCASASEAALKLNAELFKKINVTYHPTKRPRPDQSPSESMAAGYASCSGLSILLVDACRSVGIPARVVGTPAWFTGIGDSNGNHAGNHTWVEIWDRQWHVIGASEVSPLDQTWFLDNASKQLPAASDPRHKIYATVFGAATDYFPMVWDPSSTYVAADDVTPGYSNRTPFLLQTDKPAHLSLRQSGRLIADLLTESKPAQLILCSGQSYDVALTYDGDNKKSVAQTLIIPPNAISGSVLHIKN